MRGETEGFGDFFISLAGCKIEGMDFVFLIACKIFGFLAFLVWK